MLNLFWFSANHSNDEANRLNETLMGAPHRRYTLVDEYFA